MRNKGILLEEIGRIHEIMGLPKKKLIVEGAGRWEAVTTFADELLAGAFKTFDDFDNPIVKFGNYIWERPVFDDVIDLLKSPNPNSWVTAPEDILNKALLLIRNTYQPGGARSVVDDIYDDLFTALCKDNDMSEAELLQEINILMTRNNWTMETSLKYLGIQDPFFIKTLQRKIGDRMSESADAIKNNKPFKDLNPKPDRLIQTIKNAADKVKYEPPPGLSLAHEVIFTWLTLPKWALFAGSIQKYYAKIISDSIAKKKTLEEQIDYILGDIIEANRIVSDDLGELNSNEVLVRLKRSAFGAQAILAKSNVDDLEKLYQELEIILKESLTGKQAEKIPEVMKQLRAVDPFDKVNYFGSWVDNFMGTTATSQLLKNFLDMTKVFVSCYSI